MRGWEGREPKGKEYIEGDEGEPIGKEYIEGDREGGGGSQ